MATPRTDAVGKSECPIKGCTEVVPVFKYRERSPSDSTKRRFAGRLYCVCAKHGRVENQEFLLEHIEWHATPSTAQAQRANPPVAHASPPVTAPATRPVSTPVKAPVATLEKPKKSNSWLPSFWSEE